MNIMRRNGRRPKCYNMFMESLNTLRDKWAEVDAEETRLLRQMTTAESVKEFSVLYDAYADRLQADEPAAWLEREMNSIERQRRLLRLAVWLKAHPNEAAQVSA
jgi:hypothetical protein